MASSVLIVTPYAAAANNGNWRTAERWARLLSPEYRAIVRTPADSLEPADVLIALHARRSHVPLRDWRERYGDRPCIAVLTGTDLYNDVPRGDPAALATLAQADGLIVLQDRAVAALPAGCRAKARVVYQSAPALVPYAKSSRGLRVLFVGHLRPEKDPETFVRAAAELRDCSAIRFAMVGGTRDPGVGRALGPLLSKAPNVVALGALSHAVTRQHIRRAHLLVVPSRMEGGANVVVEALTAGTAVLASDCDGNVGMLGARYPGYFPVGEPDALARLLRRCREDRPFLARLEAACRTRAPRFAPAEERRALLAAISAGTRARARAPGSPSVAAG